MISRQYILDFPVLNSHSTEDFVVGGCNKVAATLISQWPDWPAHALVLVGAPASGKTHLAKILAEKTSGQIMPAKELRVETVPNLSRVVILEGADKGVDEKALFHLYNWTRDTNGFLMLTASAEPAKWQVALKDLNSRLQGTPLVRLEQPGEDILGAAMAKQFSDRQLVVDDKVIAFLLKRIERSFSAVRSVVSNIDSLSLREKSRVTIPLARKILDMREGTGGPE